MRRTVYTLLSILAVTTVLNAQDRPVSFQFGGGYTLTTGNTGRHLDNGFNITGGVGYNFNSYVGAMVNAAFTRSDINTATLNNIGVPDGNVRVFSLTLDPIVHVHQYGYFDIYVTGGGGLYHRTQEFTQPGAATVVGFDPFFGFYQTQIATTQVLASYSVNKPGADIGAGVSFGSKWNGKFYAESRFHRIFYGNDRHSDYLPVTFGFRW